MVQIVPGTYVIDASHSEVGFSVRHAGIAKVRGSFTEFEGAIEVGENGTDSKANVSVDLASVDTRSEARDQHLRSADFFNVEVTPTMTFASTSVKIEDAEDFVLRGELTLNGVTMPVEIEAEYTGTAIDPYGQERIGFSGETKINRKDFGLTWNAALETGGVLVSDRVNIVLEVSAVKQA
ncbi:MAG TPA: YceI family protein [Actinomycetaceae bacterium]|nr:YceI family protein [Actinomycetaceae bacterium]